MNVIYYLPAHPSYFPKELFTQAEVDQAVSKFQSLFKPGKSGDIPEQFVFVTEPGKYTGPRFDSTDMKSPDEATKIRWTDNTLEFALEEFKRLVQQITDLLEGARPSRDMRG
jgi:hypothetical protein